MHQDSASPAKRFAFLLLEKFSLIAFAATIEPLRMANRQAGKTIYTWRILSETGEPVACSNGARIEVDGGLVPLERDETVLVCGGVGIRQTSTKGVLAWIRREARKGVDVGGICTAAQTLAMAGLLDGRSCTIHWENRDGFREEYPEIELEQTIFVIDRGRMTASGGTAPTDLMLKLIADAHGPDLAAQVADGLIHPSVRSERDEQRMSIPTRIGVRHPKLAAVIKRMEDNIEEPVSPSILAKEIGMSTRQLERLFRRYLNRSPKRYYMELRLNRARNLLVQTDMSVIQVALACGFASPSHFSKCYRAQFETTPYRERGAAAAGQL